MRDLLSIHLVCYEIVRRKQHMRVWRPLKYKFIKYEILAFQLFVNC